MLLLSLALPLAEAAPAYLRFPDTWGDTVVFVADGDLWAASSAGTEKAPALARRLTAHVGGERNPRISPDGRWVAFTGEYDGNPDVYLVPVDGGQPKRLTWNPADDLVLGFTPDGASVIFRSRRSDPNMSWRVYTVPVGGGDASEVPLGWAGWLDVDPQSGRYAFTRTGFEARTWKRYRGGTADDIWAGDPKAGTYTRLTTFEGADSYPMWRDGKIYFLSDEGGTARLWVMNADGTGRTPLTKNEDWDVRAPAMGNDGRIVYMLGADLWIFDPKTGASRMLAIDVPVEADRTRVRYTDAAWSYDWVDLSPDGERVLVGARGEVWSVPVEEGVSLPVTKDSGARERVASFSADGKSILYVTDASGEEAVARMDAWGRGEETVVIPAGKTGWLFAPMESPDGKWVAWADEKQALYVAPAGGGAAKQVDRGVVDEIREYTWSPDSRWLAYARTDARAFTGVYVYDTKEGVTRLVTPRSTVDSSPAWDPEGRFLYVLGDHDVNPVLGARDFDYVVTEPTRPYAIPLRPDVKNPFVPRAGLPEEEGDAAGGEDGDGDKDAAKDPKKGAKDKKGARKGEGKGAAEAKEPPKPVEIDFEGISTRMVPVPVPAFRGWGLSATSNALFWTSVPVTGMASGDMGGATLWRFDLDEREAAVFASGVRGFTLARGGESLLYLGAAGEVKVAGTGSAPPMDEKVVDLSGIVITLDPAEEWRQMYFEAWRNMRDFYWDPGMANVGWEKIRDQYAKLLPRITTRGELNDLLGELIGELGTSHTYVGGGDPGGPPAGDHVAPGQLGADVVREGQAFKITRIFRADPADRDPSPLLDPGVNVKEGEYIVAVNHRRFAPGEDLDAALANTAGRRVVLSVNTRPGLDGAREVVVTPVGSDASLRYHDWVRRNREYVEQKSGGKYGYLHIPDMGAGGLVAFDTWFYPQLDKEGLVVDVRWNRGGFVSQLILERLNRELIAFCRARGGGLFTYPDRVLNGKLVVITNEFAGSDGDIFPRSVQALGLGPVIGQRSWGGVVGIRGDKPLVDGGYLTQPEYAYWWPKTGWGIENHGVDPDIPVQNLPQDVAAGRDPQLDRAITELGALLGKDPPLRPGFEPAPDKSRDAYEKREPRK